MGARILELLFICRSETLPLSRSEGLTKAMKKTLLSPARARATPDISIQVSTAMKTVFGETLSVNRGPFELLKF